MSDSHVVATVIIDGVLPFELAVTAEVFGIDRSDLSDPWYTWKLCSAGRPNVQTAAGFGIRAPFGLDQLDTADTIIVAPTIHRTYPRRYLQALRTAHARGARIVSLCSGAFVLAEAGLLDGRKATTHWNHLVEFRALYPHIDIDSAVLYVDDGSVLTSAGTAAGIDLCLHIVRCDLGAEIANQVARRMVVAPHRDGGQAQYVEHPIDADDNRDLLAGTLQWIETNLATDISVEGLASRTAMSPRTFARRFRAVTGTTPHHWIVNQRLAFAQRLLETTDMSVERVAGDSGFGTSTNLRLHFQRTMKTTPSRYRTTFRLRQPSEGSGGAGSAIGRSETGARSQANRSQY